uniref:Uncharacterized protein n=1 Tax=Helianthus annuus TaxID=4232 RepID=A0A251S0D5_HELAN
MDNLKSIRVLRDVLRMKGHCIVLINIYIRNKKVNSQSHFSCVTHVGNDVSYRNT